MAVIFNIKCKSEEEMHELRQKVRVGLSGSPGFVDNEIFIADLQDDAFSLLVGQDNDHNIEFDVHSSDLLER